MRVRNVSKQNENEKLCTCVHEKYTLNFSHIIPAGSFMRRTASAILRRPSGVASQGGVG
jgi:hypothetical protein